MVRSARTATVTNTATERQLEEAMAGFRYTLISMLRSEAENMGYSVSYLETLRYVATIGNPTMKDIARHLGITPPSVTALAEAMIKKKLLTRISDPADRRSVRVSLTPKAWKLFGTLEKRKEVLMGKMFAHLTVNEKKTLIDIMRSVTERHAP